MRSDQIVAFLLRNSNLTEAQLDTILASNTEGSLDFKRGLREKGRVSKGAFARTLKQARRNVESSIFTLFLLAYLDLVPSESFFQLSRTARMLSQLRAADPTREDTLRVIGAMEEFAKEFQSKSQR
jgi:hypothetical protein